MERIPLSEFVKENSQEKAASLIGVHQTAISKALREGRNILLTSTESGVQAIEIKPFPSSKK
ncbi:putative regulatory protein Cro [Providencia alcalifaciens RIMD 1656011]|uniref:Cro/CI family transcriptional regulator n=1 Tax=Providencia alcalifaciens TaxID=126385 RepID=UPI00044EAC04|nr:Cro/CI family transcriptional regulator [Providencia alcalifaciens]EUD04819.1 putative regulatory protein Cro [Providencia alcalifaciens RIMD 1656011]